MSMPNNLTRIKNNQITDSTIQAGAKLAAGSITGNLLATTVTFNSNITILGNLTVSNSFSQLNSVNTYINDPIVVFNNGYEGSPTYDIGILVNRNLSSLAPYGAVNAALVWKEADAAFEGIMTTETGTSAGAINSTGYANLKIGNITGVSSTISGISAVTGAATFASTVGITGATTLSTATAGGLQAQAIGNVTPGSGVFTTLTSNLAVVNYLTGGSLNSNVTLTGHLIPSANITYNLGDPTHRFGTLYLSGSTILLGGTTLQEDGASGLTVYGINATRGNITTLQSTNFSTGNAVITGGSVNGAPIGASSASTGAFTTGTYSSTLGVTGATTLSTATTGALQAQAIGNVTPGSAAFTTGTFSSTLGVTGATTLSTATTGALQAQAIGNVTPGTAAFTTGTFSSTLGVTGATTLSTATTGALQAQAIGNVTPGTAAFTTATTGSLQGIIGNATATTAFFTTANATTVNAATIGNVGTAFTGASSTLTGTAIATTVNAATIGNASAVLTGSFGNITTINATNVNAVTIGNVGASVIGDGGFLSNIMGANVAGTVTTANASIYAGVTNSAFNSNFYVAFTNASGGSAFTGNTQLLNSTLLNFNPSTGTLAATAFSGGTGSFTTVTAGSYQGIIGNVTPAAGTFTSLTAQTETVGGLQAVAIGNVTPGTGVFTTGTFNTATTGGLQAQAIGNVTPGSAAFTTGTFSSTLGVTGATTLSTATAGGLQAQAIGNVTPGTGNFSTLQATNFSSGNAVITGGSLSGIASFNTTTLQVTNFSTANAVITGGSVNGATIGATSASTGAFTTLTASGATTVTNTTESTSAGTGALLVSGGVGIAKNLNVTGSAFISGNLTVTGTLTAIQSTTLDVSDLNITVAKGAASAAAANGAGITVDGASATILYTNATDTWNLNKGLVVTTGSLSSTLNVTGATTLSTATTGGLQAQAIGNVTPGSGAFTTGTFSSTLGVTGATTLSTATAGGLQAQAIGNVTPGTGAFTTTTAGGLQAQAIGNVTPGSGAFTTTTAGGLQAQAIGNVTPGTAAFTTGTFSSTLGVTGATTLSTATTGGLQAQAIGNVTPGTGAFTTATTGGLQAQAIGNVTPGSAAFTTGTFSSTLDVTGATTLSTATAGGLQAQAIGNVIPGTGNFTTVAVTNFSSGNAVITGGSVNGAPIGASSASTGAFTTGTFSSTLGVTGATTLSTATTGGLQAQAIGNVTPGTGAFTTLTSSGTTIASGNIVAAATTSSTNTTTGALVVKGGAGISGAVNIGTSLTVDGGSYGNVVATQYGSLYATAYGANNYALLQTWSPTTGGGIGLNAYGNIVYSAGAINFTTGATIRDKDYPTGGTIGIIFAANGAIINKTGIASTTTSTGALVVEGGAGISGAVNIGSTLGVTGATTLSTATAGGLQAQAIGNVTPGSAAFTTGTFSSTLGVTGATTLSTATAGGLQAQAIGNVTPGSAAFTTGTFSSTLGVTGATTLSTATAGGLQAQAIGNVTQGTGNFTTVAATNFSTGNAVITGGSLSGIASFSTTTLQATNFSTANAVITGGSVNGATIGATSASTGAFTTITGSSTIIAGGNIVAASGTDSSSTTTGALVVVGGIGASANVFHGKATTMNSTQVAGGDTKIQGVNDSTLLWARPSSAYDQVLIGNSATVATLVRGAKLQINSTDSILLPAGTNAQRPGSSGGTDTAGMFRFSTTATALEVYDGAAWSSLTSAFTVITDENFNGDSSAVNFTMAAASTTAATIVSINGILQIPTLAYSVSGTTLTFTEAPQTGDLIDVRRLATTSTVTQIASANGYMSIQLDNAGTYFYTGTSSPTLRTKLFSNGAMLSNAGISSTNISTGTIIVDGGVGISGALNVGANVTVTGNVLPSANVTYNLGSPSQRWKDLWLSGNTIDLAGAVIKTDPATGAVAIIPNPTTANPNPIGVVISPAGTVSTVTTTAGVPAVGSISTSANTASVSSTSTFANANITSTTTSTSTTTGALIVAGGAGIAGTLNVGANVTTTGSILPSANVTYSLGSTTKQWKDIYVGPGSLYVNGKAVIQDTSGTITFSTDIDQNLSIKTSGTGDIQMNPSGSGAIALQGPIKITAGKNFVSSDGNAIGFSNQIAVDSITSKSADTDLTLVGAGTGKVYINDNCTITGNLTVSGTTTTINTTTLSVADNLVDLNSDVTTGSPTEDAGIRVLRGDSTAVQLKWNETVDSWQITNDGATYANIVQSTVTTLSSLTSVGTLTSLAVGAVTSSGNIVAASNTTSTSATTGALVVAGGVGIAGNVFTAGWIVPTANTTQNLGTTTNWWGTLYGVSTQAKYADLAENYQADNTYASGVVLMFGGDQEVTIATADTTAVAGVVSQNPAHLMNGGLSGTNVVPLALQGRVPCNVIGPIKKGDLMISAGFGYAKATTTPKFGQIIGKALSDFAGARGQIEVVVGRT